MILQWLKVEGGSLRPDYDDGDYVLVSSLPVLLQGVRPGDVVVFHHPRLGKLIKIVERLENSRRSVYVIGRDPDSLDSRTFGAIPLNLILGKVVLRIPRT